MNKLHRFKDSGFTIIELIVVIIIIAILASFTLVGYGAISKTAYNTQIVAGVVQYKDTIEAYKAYFKSYPKTTREIAAQQIAVVCLGDGYPQNYCGKVTGVDIYEDSTFSAELAKIGQGGNIAVEKLSINSEIFVGAVYGIDTTDLSKSPTGYARTIQYALRGADADCKVDGAWKYALQDNPPMTACEIILETVPAR